MAALEHIDDYVMYCDDPELSYFGLKFLQKQMDEMYTYIRNNKMMIPNYGEMHLTESRFCRCSERGSERPASGPNGHRYIFPGVGMYAVYSLKL
jgi:hypothetical protein